MYVAQITSIYEFGGFYLQLITSVIDGLSILLAVLGSAKSVEYLTRRKGGPIPRTLAQFKRSVLDNTPELRDITLAS